MQVPSERASGSNAARTPFGVHALWLFPISSATLAASAFAQNTVPPAFEAASVKISHQEPSAARQMNFQGDTLTMRNLNFPVIVAWAYKLQWPRIAGPGWIDSERFDIIAKAAKPLCEDEIRLALRALLAERAVTR